MKKNLMIIILMAYAQIGFCQIYFKDIPYNLNEINQRDENGKQGIWYTYDRVDSSLYGMQHYKNDTLHGYFERYWNFNGNVSERGYYKNGELDSVLIAYWENGAIRGEAFYADGKLNGIATSFNKEGKITSRVRYTYGTIDSTYSEMYRDSTIVWDSEAKNKIDTLISTYNSVYNKKYSIYINDTLSKEIIFYDDIPIREDFYKGPILTKRVVYSKTSPQHIEKVFYYDDEKLVRSEFYNKKGNLTRTEP